MSREKSLKSKAMGAMHALRFTVKHVKETYPGQYDKDLDAILRMGESLYKAMKATAPRSEQEGYLWSIMDHKNMARSIYDKAMASKISPKINYPVS